MAADSKENGTAGKDAATEEKGAEEDEEEEEEKKEEGPKEPVEAKELEEDAAMDKGPTLQTAVTFLTEDTTMNCLPSEFGNMLMQLSDGGFQYLFAGARANAGLKSGRYMFEVKLMEFTCPSEDASARNKTPLPRNQLRIGFSTSSSSLFVGELDDSVCFTADGVFLHNKSRQSIGAKLQPGDVAAVLLNLDESSPNAKTISLFKNGKRACKPQALPECLLGKALFPAVTFKNVTLHYNFGPTPLAPLPFTCHMIQDASETTAVVSAPAGQAKDGRNEVIFPVCLPDEGTFDWLDLFLETNKNYTELSDRAILAWAEKSGLRRTRAAGSGPGGAAPELVGQRNSNDKPEMGFGINAMDDGSVRRVMHAIAPLQRRNYILMEVKANLLQEERKDMVAKWATSGFKRTAAVMMGEPPPPLKKRSQELILKAKQEAAEAEFKVKKAEEKKRRMVLQKQKRLEKEKKKAAKLVAKKKMKEARAKAKAEGVVEEEPLESEDEVESEEEKDDEELPDVEEQPPKAELNNEEKKQWFRKKAIPDLSAYALGSAFMDFSIPDKEEEGFDEVRCDWAKSDKCKDYLRQWIRDRKLTTRVEDLQPSDWFSNKWKEWQKTVQEWRSKQSDYKERTARKPKPVVVPKPTVPDGIKEPGKVEAKAKTVQDSVPERADAAMEPADEEDDAAGGPPVDFERLDVFGVEDILNIGRGQPLFSAFNYEDWTLMGLRFELYLLTHAFRKDVNDPDRLGVHVEHLPFYYNKYFKKALNLKFYGAETVKDLLEFVRDTVVIRGKSQVVEAQLPEELESWGIFAMLTEESRRDRMRRIDLGDESAKLALSQHGNVATVSGTPPSGRTVQAPVAARPVAAGWKGPSAAWSGGGTSGGWTPWSQNQGGWRGW